MKFKNLTLSLFLTIPCFNNFGMENKATENDNALVMQNAGYLNLPNELLNEIVYEIIKDSKTTQELGKHILNFYLICKRTSFFIKGLKFDGQVDETINKKLQIFIKSKASSLSTSDAIALENKIKEIYKNKLYYFPAIRTMKTEFMIPNLLNYLSELLKIHYTPYLTYTNFGSNNTFLTKAISQNDLSLVQKLLKIPHVGINYQMPPSEQSPLICSLSNERSYSDSGNHYFIQSPLNINIALELLKLSDLNVNLQDKDGFTALARAAQSGHREIISALLTRNDLKVNLPTNKGQTPLMLAIANKHTDIAKELLKRKDINVNIQSASGMTALLLAIDRGQKEIVTDLLNHPKIDICLEGPKRITAYGLAKIIAETSNEENHKKVFELIENFKKDKDI